MRSILLSGFAVFSVLAATVVAPAHAQLSITRGGHNNNFSKGAYSMADQYATTLSGTAKDYGKAITRGGHNNNFSKGAYSYAGQDTTTVGGYASGYGKVITNGGYNKNFAKGDYSSATQS